MRRMQDALLRADEALRRALLGAPGACLRIALHAAACAGFALLLMTRTMPLLAGAGLGARALTVLLLTLPLALTLHAAGSAAKGEGLLAQALLAAVCAAGMLARVSFLDHVSSDYEIYLADWLARFGAQSFGESMRGTVGEYNVLYQYILFVITRLPVPPLYAVKAVSFVGDACLCGAAASLAGRKGKRSALALCVLWLLPIVVLDGGMFAQCDSLYAACALWGLAHALRGRGARSAACFALSLAFKLQAAFLLPMVAALWAGKKLRLGDALVFAGTLVLCALPALLGGKSVEAILSIYMGQTGLYTGLTYNAPTLFGLMHTAGLDAYAYGNFGMALALGAALLIVARCAAQAEEMDDAAYLRTSLLLVLAVVFLLPRMHERYFFLADVLAATLACRDGRFALPAGLIGLASLSRLWEMGMPLAAASALMLLAILLVIALNCPCEKHKTCV